MVEQPAEDSSAAHTRRFPPTPTDTSIRPPAISEKTQHAAVRSGDGVLETRLPAETGAVALARAVVRDTGRDLADDVLDDLEVIVAELVANAIRHGRPDIALRVRLTPTHIHIAVSDHGPGFIAAAGVPDTASRGGRGLLLVDRLANTWGVHTVATSGGKVVWASIALPVTTDEPVV